MDLAVGLVLTTELLPQEAGPTQMVEMAEAQTIPQVLQQLKILDLAVVVVPQTARTVVADHLELLFFATSRLILQSLFNQQAIRQPLD
jgi:hypothetical protein